MTRRATGGAESKSQPGQRAYSSSSPRPASRDLSPQQARGEVGRVVAQLRSTPLELFLAARLVRTRLHARHALRRFGHQPVQFSYLGRQLDPLEHPYNRTWLNERQIELAVANDFLERIGPTARGLEVGNVLGHYRPIFHEVVDRYETGPGVSNVDVVDIPPGARYDFIIAISTLEHVGWDESPQDPTKANRALRHLRRLLRPEGTLLLSLPLGYNPVLDAEILALDVARAETYALDRAWRWRRRPVQPRDFTYHHELRSAQALWVGEIPPVTDADI